jgi:CheY-like chemotaxis protein
MAYLLIVDDEPDTLRILCLALQIIGHQAQGAPSGPAALQLLAESPPDGVLLDVMMPEMDGFETLHRIRCSPATRDLPVIFVTASAEADLEARAAAAGAQGVLRKPVDLNRLGEWIEQFAARPVIPLAEPSFSHRA